MAYAALYWTDSSFEKMLFVIQQYVSWFFRHFGLVDKWLEVCVVLMVRLLSWDQPRNHGICLSWIKHFLQERHIAVGTRLAGDLNMDLVSFRVFVMVYGILILIQLASLLFWFIQDGGNFFRYEKRPCFSCQAFKLSIPGDFDFRSKARKYLT